MRWIMLIRSGIEERASLLRTYFLLSGVGLVLVLFRQFIPTDKPMMFLLWNLFLALLPLAFSTLILRAQRENSPRYMHLTLSFLWLVFFPNAPYMLTDYIHLTYGDQHYFWLDFLTLTYFAFFAFVTAVISLKDLEKYLTGYMSIELTRLVILLICILSGIGIYLGRDLRFNSWDVLVKPRELIHVSLSRMSDPLQDIYTWTAATLISFLLFGLYILWPKKWSYRGNS